MGNVLQEICDKKRLHVMQQRTAISEAQLRERIATQTPPRGFANALRSRVEKQQTAIIAELKKASPSKGIIREDFDPITLAKEYVTGGATCISVLTDTPYFQGQDSYLTTVRAAVDIPLLRKDFMLDPYQILESRALGADCILLIMAALSDADALAMEQAAHALNMDVLIEVHDAEEMQRALKLSSPLLGVNNRNLKTLAVDITTTEQLAATAPKDRILICESGIETKDHITRMHQAGVYGFLIGESLMRQPNVTHALQQLI